MLQPAPPTIYPCKILLPNTIQPSQSIMMMMNDSSSCDLDGGDMMMMMGGGGMMKMYFHFNACEKLLFNSWNIDNAGKMVGAVIACFVLAILYEGLKTLREWLIYIDMVKNKPSVSRNEGQYESINPTSSSTKRNRFRSISASLGMHILQSLLHVVQVGYGYILMFIAMTFNGWLFLAVCFGAGTGYFIFGKFRNVFGFGLSSRESNEHCH